jgi:hypothetical protein
MQPVLYTMGSLQRPIFCAEFAMAGKRNSKRAQDQP